MARYLMKRILFVSLLGAALSCIAFGYAVGQELDPEPTGQPALLGTAPIGTGTPRASAIPARFAEHATEERWRSVDQDAGLPAYPAFDERKERFSFRGTLIGAAIGGALAYAFMTATCEHACWSHPDTPKVFGIGIGLGAAVGLGYDMNRHERKQDQSR